MAGTKNKVKLNTAIERALGTHMDRVTEGSIDTCFLYIRRNNIQVDAASLAKIMEILRGVVKSEHLSKLEILMTDLDKSLDAFLDE